MKTYVLNNKINVLCFLFIVNIFSHLFFDYQILPTVIYWPHIIFQIQSVSKFIVFIILLIIFVVFLLLLEKKKLLKNEVVDKSEVRLSLKILASIVCVPIVYFFCATCYAYRFCYIVNSFCRFFIGFGKEKVA
jgi:hypothetical protein